MSKHYLILLAFALFLLCGCERVAAPSAFSVRVEFSWEGGSAENIAEQMPAIVPSFKLAVIEDGLATVYFDAAKDFVDAELQNTRATSPDEMKVRSLVVIDTGIPEPPEQVEVERVQFEAERERMAALGVTMADLATAIKGGEKSSTAMQDPEKFRQVRVKNSNGEMVLVSDLGTAQVVRVRRPLVLSR